MQFGWAGEHLYESIGYVRWPQVERLMCVICGKRSILIRLRLVAK